MKYRFISGSYEVYCSSSGDYHAQIAYGIRPRAGQISEWYTFSFRGFDRTRSIKYMPLYFSTAVANYYVAHMNRIYFCEFDQHGNKRHSNLRYADRDDFLSLVLGQAQHNASYLRYLKHQIDLLEEKK